MNGVHCGRKGSRRSRIPASDGVRPPFTRLHRWHEQTTFSQTDVPPRERRTDVMCTGRYDLLSTSTFELRTDIPAVAPAGYRRVGPLSIFFSLSAGLHWRSPTQHGVPRSPRLVQAAEPRVVGRFPHAR